VFAQVEGLCVDEGITMAHLRGTLDHLATAMFGEGIRTRLRPTTSPSPSRPASGPAVLQLPRRLGRAGREPCRVCSSEGWIEWGGCGMVNPAVLRACGVDPSATPASPSAWGWTAR
jgi:phenylalanyl-tRNA synthetase alpha chain